MTMTTTRIVLAALVLMGAVQLSLTIPHRSINQHFLQSINFGRQIGYTHRSTSSLHLSTASPIGSVTLVGSGPGDPDLLTLQAYKLLKNASLVVSDRLVSSEILALIDCEVRVANKKPGCADDAQAELNEWVINAALEGRNVVRLKIGDPFLFGRGLLTYLLTPTHDMIMCAELCRYASLTVCMHACIWSCLCRR